MLLRKLKWRGGPAPSLVWEHQVHLLGQDEHGTWFFAPRGTPVRHADGTTHDQWADAVILFAADHVAYLWRPAPDGFDLGPRVTVDVAEGVVPPEYVDLELDVFAYADGRVEGLDEDEFVRLRDSGQLTADRARAALTRYETLRREVTLHPRFMVAPARYWRQVGR